MIPYLDAYRIAATIRAVELGIVKRYYSNPDDRSISPMRCPVHLSIGQETIAAAARLVAGGPDSELPPLVYSTHRAHAHFIAFSGNLRSMLSEIYGKATGCAGGWGGSMHLVDESSGFMGTSAIVGSSISMAVGAALGCKLAGKPNVTIAFIGDSAVESGQYYEAMNFATLHGLRLLVIEEDNGLSTATTAEKRQPVRRLVRTDWDITDAGFDLMMSVLYTAHSVVNEGTPQHVRIGTHRFYEHVGVGRDDWRTQHELLTAGDPLYELAFRVGRKDIVRIDGEIEKQVDEAFTFAEQSPWPEGVA